jgi:hypothetical protein
VIRNLLVFESETDVIEDRRLIVHDQKSWLNNRIFHIPIFQTIFRITLYTGTMQIRSSQRYQQAHSTRRPQPESPSLGTERGDAGLLDKFRSKYDSLDIHLDTPEYQNIQDLEAANMLGHFTQTMQNNGYPWELRSAVALESGGFKKGGTISDLDALNRLKDGQPLLLQPKRDLQLDLSSGSITAIAAAGSVASTDMTGLSKMAAYSKNAQVSAGSQGVSVKFGEPVVIQDFSQLKLLHQMYDPAEKIQGKSETAKTAHQFSYFTQKTVGSAFPWRFYVKDDSNTFLRVAKHTTKGAATGALVGGALAGAFGAIMAIGFKDWSYLKGAAAIGATIGGLSGGYESARTSVKGTPINSVQALENVLNDKDVIFQESRARSVNVPILGKISWFADQGKGSKISSPEQLNTFYYMQSQEDLPKPAEPKKKEEKKPAETSITILDQSVHHHYQSHPTKVVFVEEQPVQSYRYR